MPVELHFDRAALAGFLLVLARLGGALIFVPLPGVRAVPEAARALLVVSLSLALFPLWPKANLPMGGMLFLWMLGEALFGLAVGLVVGFLSDVLIFAVQSVAMQAGFSYASTIDPNSDADSSVLQIVAQLGANLLFFNAGVDHMVLRAFARSLESWSVGRVEMGLGAARAVTAMGASMMELGLRLALPVAALLLLTDVTLALLGRIQAQLQLLSLAFPVKMLAALVALAALAPLFPLIYQSGVQRASGVLSQMVR